MRPGNPEKTINQIYLPDVFASKVKFNRITVKIKLVVQTEMFPIFVEALSKCVCIIKRGVYLNVQSFLFALLLHHIMYSTFK